jgi:urease accessory protein
VDRTFPPFHVASQSFRPYLAEPLLQQPAGSFGKLGRCHLVFDVAANQTRLWQSYVQHPFHLTRPWYLDPTLPGMAVLYLQTPAGGLIQGDRTEMQLNLKAHTQVHLTTQAAEKIHTMTANCAVQQLSFELGAGAYLEYCPEPIILFPHARFSQSLTIELQDEANIFLSEILFFHQAPDNSVCDALTTHLHVHDANGSTLVRECNEVFPIRRNIHGPGLLGPYHVWGQAVFIGPTIPASSARALSIIITQISDVESGVTLLPRERGLAVKVLGMEVSAVRRVLHAVRHWLRLQYFGIPATVFPK